MRPAEMDDHLQAVLTAMTPDDLAPFLASLPDTNTGRTLILAGKADGSADAARGGYREFSRSSPSTERSTLTCSRAIFENPGAASLRSCERSARQARRGDCVAGPYAALATPLRRCDRVTDWARLNVDVVRHLQTAADVGSATDLDLVEPMSTRMITASHS
jgi:hypothetical protein